MFLIYYFNKLFLIITILVIIIYFLEFYLFFFKNFLNKFNLDTFTNISTLSMTYELFIFTLNFFILSFLNIGIKLDIFLYIYILEWIILISSIFFINFLGVKGFFLINLFNSTLMLLTLAIAFVNFNLFHETVLINLGNFFKFSYNSNINICFYIDYLNFNFCFLTSTIALFVYLYSYSYMRNELNLINFFFFLKSFVLSMLLLLISGNWITLLLGWELIGLTSFFLINFWNNKVSTLKSAFKAFSFNKLSDCALITSFLMFQYFNNSFFFNFNSSNSIYLYKYVLILNNYFSFIDFVLIFLIIAAFCKSAQFGLHFWLPDSMEAPVPASALIHSATLVSAGIYILLRFNYLFIFSNIMSNVFLVITSFTAFFGALIASFQTDIKKILAYSTISHCGFLMVSIYFSNPLVTILYLYGHGFYKSLSFMCVGNLIQSANNYQDLRKMGNLYFYSIFEFFFLTVCIFNLSSLPFFFNFFIKHFLLINLNTFSLIKLTSVTFLYLASFCGTFYSLRIVYYAFMSFKKMHYKNYLILEFDNIKIKKKFFF